MSMAPMDDLEVYVFRFTFPIARSHGYELAPGLNVVRPQSGDRSNWSCRKVRIELHYRAQRSRARDAVNVSKRRPVGMLTAMPRSPGCWEPVALLSARSCLMVLYVLA